MDPDHVFRILNVISAHYDTYKYDISQEDVNAHNKFGFDKIIVVCDVKNIKAIFEHRYGEKADFTGYFNKFFSSTVFEFNNVDYWKLVFRKDIVNKIYPDVFAKDQQDTLELLIFSFIEGGQLSLREYKQFIESNFQKFFFDTYQDDNFISKGIYTKPLFFLKELLGFEELKKRIDSLKKDRISILSANYHWHCLHLLISLSELPHNQEKTGPIPIKFLDEIYMIEFKTYKYLREPKIIEEAGESKKRVDFSKDNFYDLLLLNLDKIKELKLYKN